MLYCRFPIVIYLTHASIFQFSSVQLLSRVWLFATPWIAACQASLSITNYRSSFRPTSIESVMPSSHLILCRPLLLLPPIPPSIRVFSNESTLRMSIHAINLNQQVQLFSSSIKIQTHKLYTIQYGNKFTGMVRIHCKSPMCHRLEIKLMQLGGNWSSVMRDYRTWERTSDCEMRSESMRHVVSNW